MVFSQSCWNLWCHIPWRRRRARWTFVGFRWIYIDVWAGTWCPNSYGGIVRCRGQHWWIHRIPWHTIHGSSMAGQFCKRFFAFYVPNVHLKCELGWKLVFFLITRTNSITSETYLVIFATAGNETLIDAAEARVNGVRALCVTLIFSY